MNPIRHPLRQARMTLLHWRLVRRGLLTGRPPTASAPKRGRTESRARNEGVPPFRQGEGDALIHQLSTPSLPGGGGVVSTTGRLFVGAVRADGDHPNPFLEHDRRSRLAAVRSEGLSPSSPAGAAPSPSPGRDLA